MNPDERTSRIYFLRDADGEVIYIGRSRDIDSRIKAHTTQSPFWAEVAAVEQSNLMTHGDAVEYEAQSIYRQRPRHNIAGNPDRDPKLIARARAGRFDAEAEIYSDAYATRFVAHLTQPAEAGAGSLTTARSRRRSA